MPAHSVVIVHGLWMHGIVFGALRTRLRAQGFDSLTFSYASIRRAFDEHVHALALRIGALRSARVHLIGHSLGGLLCMQYACTYADARLGRIVLLGSPVRGSSVAKQLSERGIGKYLLGAARDILVDGLPSSLSTSAQVGVIAGNGKVGLGRLLASLDGPHDGTVAVRETTWPDVADTLVLPVTHTSMVFSAEVAEQAAYFLRHGHFSKGIKP